MVLFKNYFLSVTVWTIASCLQKQISAAAEQLCDFELIVGNADHGVVYPNSEALLHSACSWRIRAALDRKLLVIVDNVYLFHENATLTIMIDGKNESTYSGILCKQEHRQFVGSTLQITYRSFREKRDYEISSNLPSSALVKPLLKFGNSSVVPQVCNTTNFTVRYASFNPLECDAPESPINGFVVDGKTRKIGEVIQYQCSPPYLFEKGSLSNAVCVLNSATPMPFWSSSPPKCILPECGKMPIKIPLSDSQNTTLLKLDLKFGKTKNCVWEITADRRKHLTVQVNHLYLPAWTALGKQQGGATLELYDGKISENRLLTRLSGTMGSTAYNYTTVFNKLVVILRVSNWLAFVQMSANYPSNEMEDEAKNYGFSIEVSSKVPFCDIPKAPTHGDVKGLSSSTDATNLNLEPQIGLGIVFSCNDGFSLNGSEHSSCLENGQWNNPAPICVSSEMLTIASPSLEMTTVTNEANISTNTEDVILPDKSLQSRNNKDRRPHPQSTEEKTNLKSVTGKEDPVNTKHIAQNLTPSPEALDNFTNDVFEDEASSGSILAEYAPNIDEFDEAFSNYDSEGDQSDTGNDYFSEGDVVRDNGSRSRQFPIIAVILGVGIPLIFGIVAIAGFIVYRKLYPVRMSLGRKFETFENPVYGRNKRGPGTPLSGTLVPGASLAQSPAELQRLTRQTLP